MGDLKDVLFRKLSISPTRSETRAGYDVSTETTLCVCYFVRDYFKPQNDQSVVLEFIFNKNDVKIAIFTELKILNYHNMHRLMIKYSSYFLCVGFSLKCLKPVPLPECLAWKVKTDLGIERHH